MTHCNPAEQQLIRILKSRKTALSGPELAAMLATSDRQVRAMNGLGIPASSIWR